MCDDAGTVYVRMKGASVRALDTYKQRAEKPRRRLYHTMLIPAWEPVALEKPGKQRWISRRQYSAERIRDIRA